MKSRVKFCRADVFGAQAVPGQLHVHHRRPEPELRLHELRQLRLGVALCLSTHDAGLLGKPLPICKCLLSVTTLLHFAWVVDDAKCIAVTRVCVSVCLSVCLSIWLSAAACPHYCTDPDVTWGSGRGCPLVVHCWADLQSLHGLRCYGNITRTRNISEYMLVLALCLDVLVVWPRADSVSRVRHGSTNLDWVTCVMGLYPWPVDPWPKFQEHFQWLLVLDL